MLDLSVGFRPLPQTTRRLAQTRTAHGYASVVDQVLRIKGRSDLGGALGRHAAGQNRPAEAKPRDGMPAVVPLRGGDMPAARKALDTARRVSNLRGGHRAHPAREFLFAGPRFSDGPDVDPKTETRRLVEWGQACVDWVQRRAGRAVIAVAALHLDEAQPHVHLVLVPVDQDGKLRWARGVERQFMPDPSDARIRGSEVMSKIQDCCHEEVGQRFGLDRGERGSGKRHEPINRKLGFVRRVLTDPLTGWTAGQKLEAGREAAAMLTGALETADRAHRGRRRADRRAAAAVAEADERVTTADQRAAAAVAEADERVTAADQRAAAAVAEADERVTAADQQRRDAERGAEQLRTERDQARTERDQASVAASIWRDTATTYQAAELRAEVSRVRARSRCPAAGADTEGLAAGAARRCVQGARHRAHGAGPGVHAARRSAQRARGGVGSGRGGRKGGARGRCGGRAERGAISPGG